MEDIIYFLFIAIGIIVSIVNQARKKNKDKEKTHRPQPAPEQTRTEAPRQGGAQSVEDMIQDILDARGKKAEPISQRETTRPKPAPKPKPVASEPLERYSNDQELNPGYEVGSYEEHTILHSLDHIKEAQLHTHKKKKRPKRIKALGNRPFNLREAIIMSEIMNRKYK